MMQNNRGFNRGGPGGPAPDGQKKRLNTQVLKRLFSYMGNYRPQMALVVVCILLSAVAGVSGGLFLQTLIDDYISPLIGQPSPVFTPLLHAIMLLGGIYVIGIVASFCSMRMMAVIGQSMQKKIRDQLFSHMQTLPIKYFDTHPHGDTMSRFTNDIDTLRQMISQSIPQLVNSVVTITFVFCAMIYTSIPLSIAIAVMVFSMLTVVKKLGGKSGKYFKKQQGSLGKLNGYIEEMLHGQKVVKVFCHEEDAKKTFDELNDTLREDAAQAF